MKYRSLLVLAIVVASSNFAPAIGESSKDPLAEYSILFERNIFSRKVPVSKKHSKIEEVVDTTPYVSLAGITELNGDSTIFTSGTMSGVNGTYKAGETIGPFIISSISQNGALLESENDKLQWDIGSRLQDMGSKWKVVHVEETYSPPVIAKEPDKRPGMGDWKKLPGAEGDARAVEPIVGLPPEFAKIPPMFQKKILDRLKGEGFIEGKPMSEQSEEVQEFVRKAKEKMMAFRKRGSKGGKKRRKK